MKALLPITWLLQRVETLLAWLVLEIYARRAGVVRDEKIVLKWLTLSAHAGGEWLLGEQRLSGRAGTIDYGSALIQFRQSASQGNKAARYREGLMYQKGLEIAPDYLTASSRFMPAAKQDYGPAKAALSAMYDMGLGVQEEGSSDRCFAPVRKGSSLRSINAWPINAS